MNLLLNYHNRILLICLITLLSGEFELLAQSVSNGPIRVQVRVIQVYARDFHDQQTARVTGGAAVNAENVWQVAVRDAANLDGRDWRGTTCINYSVPGASFPYTSPNFTIELMNQLYISSVPTNLEFRQIMWENDCGPICTYNPPTDSICFGDGDDGYVNSISSPIPIQSSFPIDTWVSFWVPGNLSTTDYAVRYEVKWSCENLISMSLSAINESTTGANDASVNLSVSYAAAPLIFQWSNGATTQHLSGIGAGDYMVTVTSSTGCSATRGVSIPSETSPDKGPMKLEVRVAQLYARDYNDVIGNAENTWKIYARDHDNLDGMGFRGGQCTNLSIGATQFPFVSPLNGTVIMDHTYGNSVPGFYQLSLDAWEEDCLFGTTCVFDDSGLCAFDKDDARCNVTIGEFINYRLKPAGQWNNDGWYFACGGEYGVRVESRWNCGDCNDNDLCTTDTCIAGVCVNEPVCVDGDPCTLDSCVSGVCSFIPLNCDDGNPCTIDSCGGDQCYYIPINCDDGDACTVDSCSGGVCINLPVICDDGDPCTVDYCDGFGCVFNPVNCDDGDPCTMDECVNGTCVNTPISGCLDYACGDLVITGNGQEAGISTYTNTTNHPITLRITAIGGGGGNGFGLATIYDPNPPYLPIGENRIYTNGSEGATVRGDFVLPAGQTLLAIAGGKGQNADTTANDGGGGGGAGSGVVNLSTGTLLILAAGGTGAVHDAPGLGGSSIVDSSGMGGAANTYAAGGGGYISDGIGASNNGCANSYGRKVNPAGISAGGQKCSSWSGGAGGSGMGGGAGASDLAGGGGGYTGGDGGTIVNWLYTSATSYNTGSSQTNSDGQNNATPNEGIVIIECISGDCTDDGNMCTVDTCINGVYSNIPLNCDDDDPCTIDFCKPATGCQHTPIYIFNVNSTADSGPGTLRQLISCASPGDTITFDSGIDGLPIVLTLGEIIIDKDLTILGNGVGNTIIDGNDNSRVFNITSGNVFISGMTIQNGYANSGNNRGGGILHDAPDSLVVHNCFFIRNRATVEGGAFLNDGKMAVVNSTFSKNHSTYGGAFCNYGGALVSVNSTFTGNSANYGGAAYLNAGTITFDHSTFSANSAVFNGGAIYNNAVLTIDNSIIAGNTAGTGPDGFNNFALSATSSFNLIGDNTALNMIPGKGNLLGSFSSPIDPVLGPLADNGGPTKTMALRCFSPAIDAADTTWGGNDQRDLPVFNGRNDMGAFELQYECDTCASYVYIDTTICDGDVFVATPLVYNTSVSDVLYLQAANGCDSIIFIEVIVQSPLVYAVNITDEVNCAGLNEGQVQINLNNDFSTYLVAWSTGDTSTNVSHNAILTGISEGGYFAMVTTEQGCDTMLNFNVGAPSVISLSAIATASTGNNGDIDLIINGGTPPYTINWSTGDTTEDLTGLAAETYSVIVSNPGCSADSLTVVVDSAYQLTGRVWRIDNAGDTFLVNSGRVSVYSPTSPLGGFEKIDEVSVSSSGRYYTNVILEDSVILLASPNPGVVVSWIPTYFGGDQSWANAQTHYPFDPQPYDIYCLAKPEPVLGGTGNIEGQVTTDLVVVNTRGDGTIIRSDPIDNVGVSLKGNVNQLLGFISTDTNGTFLFEDLPPGMYQIEVDFPGIPMTPVNVVDIDTANQIVSVLVTILDSIVTLEVIVCNIQSIPINNGWSLISSYIDPETPDIIELFSDISSEILIVKNSFGAAYIPTFNINTIGDWKVEQGYQVKSSGSTTLTMGCEKVDPAVTPITLPLGWSSIAYLRDEPMNAVAALSSISGNTLIVKNVSGSSYIPAFGINTIGLMEPGQGYKIKLNNADTLYYPANGSLKFSNDYYYQLPRKSTYFKNVANTGHNATIIIPVESVLGLGTGDEIAVFNQSGLLAGVAVYEGINLAVTVWGDDPTTNELDGLKLGDEFVFHIWRAGELAEFTAEPTFESGEVHYRDDGVTVLGKLDIKHPLKAQTVLNIYPNPTENLLHVEYYLPETDDIIIRIIDIYGKEIFREESFNRQSGKYLMTVDLSEFSSGLYLFDFRSGGMSQTVKVQKH